MKIKLYNRDHADLYLEQIDNSNLWELKVDKKHDYVLNYIRCILDENDDLEAIDPAGGPMLAIGGQLDGKYMIEDIVNSTTLKLHERDNDSQEYSN